MKPASTRSYLILCAVALCVSLVVLLAATGNSASAQSGGTATPDANTVSSAQATAAGTAQATAPVGTAAANSSKKPTPTPTKKPGVKPSPTPKGKRILFAPAVIIPNGVNVSSPNNTSGTAVNWTEAAPATSNTFLLNIKNSGPAVTTGTITLSANFSGINGLTLSGVVGGNAAVLAATGFDCSTSTATALTCIYNAATTTMATTYNNSITFQMNVGKTASPTGSFPVSLNASTANTTSSDNVFYNIIVVPDLTVNFIQHNGNGTGTGSDFVVNSNTGTITARIQNIGDGDSTGVITLDIWLPSTCSFPTDNCTNPASPAYNSAFTLVSYATDVGVDNLFWTCTYSTTTLPVVCNSSGTPLKAGHFAGVVLTVKAQPTATPPTLFDAAQLPTNTGGEPTSYNTNNTATESGIKVDAGPDLHLTKSHVDPFVGGAQGSYLLTITNQGAGATTGDITVTDTLPGGSTGLKLVSSTTGPLAGFPSANFVCGVVGTGNVSCTGSSGTMTLNAGASITLTLNVSVPACTGNTPPTIGSPNPNQATVTTPNGTNGQLYNTNVQDPAATTVQCVNLAITKTHSGNFVAGLTPQTYLITVTNNGTIGTPSSTSTGVITVTDTLPTGMTYDAANTTSTDYTCAATGGGTLVTCKLNASTTLGAAASDTITLGVLLNSANTCPNAPAATTLNNVASVSFLGGAPTNSTPDSTTINCADLSLVKTASTPFSVAPPAGGGTYTLVVTNTGLGLLPKTVGAAHTVITVTDQLPPGIGLVSIAPANSPTGWNCAPTSGASPVAKITCTYDLNAAGSDLAAGAPLPTITLTVSPNAPGTYLNQSNVTVSNNVLFIASDTDDTSNISTVATAPPSAVITILKQAMNKLVGGPATQTSTWFVDPTDAFDQGYQITVTNSGTLDAAVGTVEIDDTLPTGLNFNLVTLNSNTGAWTCSANTTLPQFKCINQTVIAIGASSPILIPVDVTSAAIGSVSNTAVLKGNSAINSTAIVNVQTAPTPDLTSKKTHATDPTSGGSVTWTIVVTNIGPVAANAGFTVTDTLPCATPGSCSAANAFSFVSGGGAGGFNACTLTSGAFPAQQTVSCVYPNSSTALTANGGTATLTITGTAATTTSNTAYTNSVGVVYNGTENVTANNGSTDLTPVVAANAVDLKITKSHTDPFTVGTAATYTITVTNIGPGNAVAPAGGFKVTDAIPADLTYTGFNGGGVWNCSPAAPQSGPITITCTDATEATGATPLAGNGGTLTALTINVNPTAATNGTPVNNTVTITNPPAGNVDSHGNGGSDLKYSDPTNINGACILTISKSALTNFQYNTQGQYNLVVTNTGSSPCLAPIQVQDTLAAGLTFVAPSSSAGGFSCVAGSPVVCTRNSNLPATINNTDTINLNVMVGSAGSITSPCPTGSASSLGISNQATVQNGQSNSSSNTTCTAVTSGAAPDLIISKSASVQQVAQSGSITYTLTVTNQGGAPENGNIVVTDNLDANTAYNSFQAVTGSWGCNAIAQQVQCSLSGGLANGASAAVNVTVTVSNAVPNGTNISNSASVSKFADESNQNNNTSNITSVNVNSAAVAVDPQASSVCVSPQSGLVAGSSAVVTVTVLDNTAAHNPMSGQIVTLSIVSGPGASITSTNPFTTLANGQATFNVKDTNSETASFQAQVGTTTIGANAKCTGAATWGAVNTFCPTSANSTFLASSTNVSVGSTVVFTIVTRNAANTGVPASVTLTPSSIPSGVTLTMSQTSFTTDFFGQPTLPPTISANGNATITVTATISGIGSGCNPVTMTQTITWGTGSSSGSSSANTYTLTSNFTCIPADNITTATITANIKVTSSGNPVTGKIVTMTGSPTLGTITGPSQTGGTDSSGNATFTIRSATQGTETFTAVDTTDNVTFPTTQIIFNAPGTKACVNPNATLTPISGQPSEAIVITRLLCDRDGPGFGYARYDAKYWMHFDDHVIVLGKTTRVVGLQARDLCIHKGGPLWYLVKTPLGFVVWANANFIRVGLVNFRNLPVLVPPAAPGAQGAPQAAIVGPLTVAPPTH